MAWHVYRVFRVVALCVLFCLHSTLVGIISAGMLAFEAGALQFSMDIAVLFIIFCFSVLEYTRRNVAPIRLPNLIAFSMVFVLSFIGAIGLTARGASRNGNGLCGDFADAHPKRCTKAAVAMVFTWVAVAFAGGGLVVSWLDRNSRVGSYSPSGWRGSMKELDLPKQYQQSIFRPSHSHVYGPTDSYIPRPRDPYDMPRRKRSTRSQPHQTNPQRVSSNRAPVPPLPPLPSFHPLGLETDSEVAVRMDRRQGPHRSRSNQQKEREDLPDLPPPTRRPPKDPRRMERERVKHLSPTDLFARFG